MEALPSMGNITRGISGTTAVRLRKPFLEMVLASWHNRIRERGLIKVKHPYTLSLAIGIGAVAGLRPMTAPAVIAWAAKRRWISPFATIISARASRAITELAISKMIVDKLPFTPSRLNAGPLASRVALGAICGAAVYGAVKQPLAKGVLLGGTRRGCGSS